MGSRTSGPFGVCTAVLLALAGSGRALHAEERREPPSFSAAVDVVSLSLAVTDTRGRPVPRLHASDIALYEDGVPQQISQFAQEEWPIRLSILLDGSGSMYRALPVARRAAERLVRALSPGDEAEVARFTRRLDVLQASTGDHEALARAIATIEPKGDTALYNALYVTLKELARDPKGDLARRTVVVLTDGEDTASTVSDDQLLELARRAGVVVYAIGLLPPPGLAQSTLPSYVLTALARETGGRAFFPRATGELEGVYDRIAAELRTLYGVGYVPARTRPDGAFHRIVVQTREPNLLVRHRTGYYAPAERAQALAAGGR
jgi:Ca-activated chloride channel family protein